MLVEFPRADTACGVQRGVFGHIANLLSQAGYSDMLRCFTNEVDRVRLKAMYKKGCDPNILVCSLWGGARPRGVSPCYWGYLIIQKSHAFDHQKTTMFFLF
jgi:hypothetical protein